MAADGENWVAVQKKTFTKWMNSHLRKKGYTAVIDAQDDFETGETLMNLINALYGIEIPKFNKNPKMRPHKLDNVTLALDMIAKANIKTNFLKPVHLVDKDLKMILGMIWAIILDFQIKGISVEELTAKEGLLLWCQKKTAGYRDVKVENFSTSWQSGLAFCALIHRHRPELIDYDSLDKNSAVDNLRLAFEVAEKNLGIARLLDVEDLTQVARPDERSVMTYVSEYFHCFAGMDLKELAARRIKKFVQFALSIEEMQNDYERQARELFEWMASSTDRMNDRTFGETVEDAIELFETHKRFLCEEKPPKTALRLDLEALYANIQTKLLVYGRKPYNVPSDLSTDAIESAWTQLEQAERARGAAVRDNRFRFITKTSSSVSEEQLKEFHASFAHFDKDNSGKLDKIEFKAALSALSIPFKDEEAFLKVFNHVSQGNEKITEDQFVNYLVEISEDKDTPEQIVSSFQVLSDHANNISLQQLRVPPLDSSEINYLEAKMPSSGELFDYAQFTQQCFSS